MVTRKCEYIGSRNKTCDIVTIDDGSWFDYRTGEESLPIKGAWCRKCAKESAKPSYPIYMNGKPAYVLTCTKCGSSYPMYKSMYNQRYIGRQLPNGGTINPTHGLTTYKGAADRKARKYFVDSKSAVEKKVANEMQRLFNMTPTEYAEQKKEWDEEHRKRMKQAERRYEERRAEYRNEQIQMESDRRKELIQKGVLKYVKGIGLVNTETNEVVKL